MLETTAVAIHVYGDNGLLAAPPATVKCTSIEDLLSSLRSQWPNLRRAIKYADLATELLMSSMPDDQATSWNSTRHQLHNFLPLVAFINDAWELVEN